MKSLNKDVADLLQSPLGSASQPSISFVGDPNTGIYSPGADQLAASTAGFERLRINSFGAFGINTITPTTVLDVVGTGNPTLTLRGSDAVYSGQFNIQAAGGGNSLINATGGTNALALLTNGFERARIDSSGRLLVGTLSGQGNSFLQIKGDAGGPSGVGSIFLQRGLTIATIAGAGNVDLAKIEFGNQDGAVGAVIQANADGVWGTSDYPSRLTFSTTADGAPSPTERMRITSAGVIQVADAGNIQVGTTTGTKIGTATTQKLGFYNATPVVQPAAVADATTAVDVITQLNDLLAKLRTLGIIAT